jgi:Ni/Fe-hydrogenase subunit HybB-like protein
MRKPLPMLLIGIVVLIAAWLKRYLIVVPVQSHPFLPIQHVPEEFILYKPTLIEILISVGPIIMVVMIVSVLAKAYAHYSGLGDRRARRGNGRNNQR